MTYQIVLTDEDYAALMAASQQSGAPIERLVHDAIAARYAVPQQIGHYQYPTGAPIMPEERAENERIAEEMGSEKPWLSDMVIEDRGPR